MVSPWWFQLAKFGSVLLTPVAATEGLGSNIYFQWGEGHDRDFTLEAQLDPRSDPPFAFKPDAEETRHCLLVDDVDLFNARAAAIGVAYSLFYDGAKIESTPRDGQAVLDNAERIFDDHSFMHIHRVGQYKGPLDIGNYVALPHYTVSDIVKDNGNITKFTVVDINTMFIEFSRSSKWAYLDPEFVDPKNFSYDRVDPVMIDWKYFYEFYPCSAIIKNYIVEFPEWIIDQFVGSALAPGAMSHACARIMDTCTGAYQQFISQESCVAYMQDLPVIDPLCAHKYGKSSVQGNSYMCKYLHQFMAPTQPYLHCFHSGMGLMDTLGKRKCVPSDCLSDASPEEFTSVYLTEDKYFSPGPAIFLKDAVTGRWTETLANTSHVPEATLQTTAKALKEFAGKDKVEGCSQAEEEELAQSTVYALALCLPDLGSNGACSDKCTQAVEFYLGRHIQNGGLCRCSDRSQGHVTKRSSLLTVLDVDPILLLNRCPPKTFQPRECVASIQTKLQDRSCNAGEYRTRQGCHAWNYNTMISAMYNDWSDVRQLHGRITTSDDVATAECIVLTKYEQWHRNGRNYYVRETVHPSSFFLMEPIDDKKTITRRNVTVHPSLTAASVHYDEYVAAYSNPNQQRKRVRSMPCHIDMSPHFDKGEMTHVGLSSGTPEHRGVRKMMRNLWPGLETYESKLEQNENHFEAMIIKEYTRRDLAKSFSLTNRSFASIVAQFHESKQYIDSKLDLFEVIHDVGMRVVFNVTSSQIDDETWHEVIAPSLIAANFGTDGFHRAFQGVLGAAQLNSRAKMLRLMKTIIPLEKMKEFVVETGWWEGYQNVHPERKLDLDNEYDLQDAYKWYTFDSAGITSGTGWFVLRMRQDECEIAPFWNDVSKRRSVVFESLRLDSGNGIGIIDDTSYPHFNVNMDPDKFENPFDFNPDRADWHKQFTFGAVQSEIDNPPSDDLWFPAGNVSNTTVHRPCAGRFVVPKFMERVAPLFLSSNWGQQCANGHRVREGVSFQPRMLLAKARDEHGQFDEDSVANVEVLQAEGAGIEKDADSLFILLGDFGEPPLVWAPVIARLQNYFTGLPLPGGATVNSNPGNTNKHYWATTLPGQGKGSSLVNCTFDYTSDLVFNLVEQAKSDFGYKRVYLLGRGLGGMLGWYVTQRAEQDKLLDAFITFSPHPIIFTKEHSEKSFDDFFARPLIDPILGTLYLGNPDVMQKIVFDRVDWDDLDITDDDKFAWLMDYTQFWKRTGPERMTCYYRDNFYSKNGHVSLKDPLTAADILPKKTPVSLMDFAIEPFFTKSAVVKSAYFLVAPTASNGRLLDYYSIKGRMGVHNFFDSKLIDDFAWNVARFVNKANTITGSSWQFVVDVTFKSKLEALKSSGGMISDGSTSTSGMAAIIFALLMVLTGLQLEHLVGPTTLKVAGTRERYRFCKIFSTVTFYTTLGAGKMLFILVPFTILAVFDFGFPQAAALLSRPWREVNGLTKFMQWRSFFDGVGVIIHHSGGFVVMAAVASGRSSGFLFLFPGAPIMIEHILVSFNVFRASTNAVYKYAVMVFLLLMEVWLYMEIRYLWFAADALGAVGSAMIASGHVIWLTNTIAEIIYSVISMLRNTEFAHLELEAVEVDEGPVRRRTAVTTVVDDRRRTAMSVVCDEEKPSRRSTIGGRGTMGGRISQVAGNMDDFLADKEKLTSMLQKFELVMKYAEDEYPAHWI